MDRTVYVSPSAAHVNLCATSPAKSITFGLWVSGPGQAHDAGGASAQVDYSTSGGLAGVSITTDPAPGYYSAPSWPAWNYGVGENPLLLVTVTVIITPTGSVTSGDITVIVYGSTAQIHVNGFVLSPDVVDDFDDLDNTALSSHAPLSQPAGGIQGWQGTGGTSIISNKAAIGCCSGATLWHRLYAALHDNHYVYVEVFRPTPIGSSPMGIAGRVNEIAGNTNTGVDIIYFEAIAQSDSLVNLQWSQLDAGVIIIYNQSIATNVAWARGTTKRLMLFFSGDKVYFYICDAGGGNPVLWKTATLTTTWNDSDHDYVGFTSSQAGRGLTFDNFRSGIITLLPDTDELDFACPCGSVAVEGQTVLITHDPEELPLALTSVDSDVWVISVLDSAFSPAAMTVSVDPTGMGPGTYYATVTVLDKVVDVVLTISENTLVVDPESLDYAKAEGDAAETKTVALVSTPGTAGDLVATLEYDDGAGWLLAELSTSTIPSILSVTCDTSGLTALGTYHATVHIACPCDLDGIDIPVTLVLVHGPPVVTITGPTTTLLRHVALAGLGISYSPATIVKYRWGWVARNWWFNAWQFSSDWFGAGDPIIVIRPTTVYYQVEGMSVIVHIQDMINHGSFTVHLSVTDSVGLTGCAEHTVLMSCIPFSESVGIDPLYVCSAPDSPDYVEPEYESPTYLEAGEPIAACDIS